MNLQDFINKYNGQSNVGNTTDNKGQCVGLVMVWLKDTLGAPHIWGHAKDLMANADLTKYDVIWNTPDGVPQAGDVINWNGRMGGGYGHTAIVTRADVNTFEVFEQNTNPKSCHIATYPSYSNVQGWIRAKNYNTTTPTDQIQVDKQTYEDLVRDATLWKDEHPKTEHLLKENERVNKEKDVTITDLRNELTEVKKQRDESDKALITLNSKIADLTSAIEKDAVDDKDNLLLVKEYEEKLAEKDREIAGLKEQKNVDVEPVIEHYEPILEEFFKNLIKGRRVRSWRERFWKWIS